MDWWKELWIGDVIWRKSDGAYGKFEGLAADGKVQFKRNMKMELVDKGDFEEKVYSITDLEDAPEPLEEEPKPMKKNILPTASEAKIDLHINAEDEKLLGNWPGSELHYQLTKCENYLKTAAASGLRDVEVIHGKGNGILRAEVHQLLGIHKSVERWGILHAGATRVWLRAD